MNIDPSSRNIKKTEYNPQEELEQKQAASSKSKLEERVHKGAHEALKGAQALDDYDMLFQENTKSEMKVSALNIQEAKATGLIEPGFVYESENRFDINQI